MIGWTILGLLLWTCLQFRPARRATWSARWTALQRLGSFLAALGTLAWWTFLKEPAQALWYWDRARRSRGTVDQALDRMLGRD